MIMKIACHLAQGRLSRSEIHVQFPAAGGVDARLCHIQRGGIITEFLQMRIFNSIDALLRDGKRVP